jgi:hypothetical protein
LLHRSARWLVVDAHNARNRCAAHLAAGRLQL